MSELNIAVGMPSLMGAFPGEDAATLPDTDFIPEQLQISRRELSLIIERLLMASGFRQGVWPGARDYVLEAIAQLGTKGVDLFEEALIERASSDWSSASLQRPDTLIVNGAAMILVGNTVANALFAYLADAPDGRFTVRGLTRTAGTDGLHVRAAYLGFGLSIDVDADAGTLEITGHRTDPDPNADLVRLLRQGLNMSGEQWWRVYQPSNFALSEETEISRSHTGVSETLLHYTV